MNQVNGETVFKKKRNVSKFQQFWRKIVEYKFLFIISIVLCLALAFLLNRYTVPVYMVSSTITVKEPDNSANSPANLLLTGEGQGFQGASLDVLQEIAVLTSSPFIAKTLSGLDFKVSYYREGNVNTNEIYGELPFKITAKDTSLLNNITYSKFRIRFSDKKKYTLTDISSDEDSKDVKQYNVGDSVSISGCTFAVTPTQYFTNDDVNTDFQVFINDINDLAFGYKGQLSVFTEEEESSILTIQFQTTIPRKGIEFLNEFTKQYIKNKYEEKSRAAAQALAFINEQISDVKGTLGNTENNIASFKASNTFSDAASLTNRNLDAIGQLENERASLLLQDKYYSSVLSDLNSNTELDQLVAPSSIGIQDGLTENLVRQLAEMQIERNSYSANGNSKNPLVQELDVKINNVKNTLKENLRSLASTNRTKLSQVNARAGQYQAKVFNIPLAERQFTDMKRVSDFNDALYQFLMQKKVEAGILKASATVESRVIESAYIDGGEPVKPNKANNYALAFLIGFVLPLSFVQLKGAMNKNITGKEEIQETTSIPIVGTIYRNIDSSPFVISTGSRTAVSESFRILRSNLTYLTKDFSKKVFLVTSTNSGEGKSFTSINLAFSLALAKRKTVLVNLDLRVPSKDYNDLVDNKIGITSYLEGSQSITDNKSTSCKRVRLPIPLLQQLSVNIARPFNINIRPRHCSAFSFPAKNCHLIKNCWTVQSAIIIYR